MYVLWYISDPTGENDDCKTAANTLSGDPPVELFVDTNDVPCDFPFRYKNVLYYGCTNITIETKNYKMCASKTDVDYNALQMSFCNDYCHCQCESFRFCYVGRIAFNLKLLFLTSLVERPEDAGIAAQDTATVTEGSVSIQQTYVLPVITELEIKRTFTVPGVEYTLRLEAYNMHVPEELDFVVLEWKVLCGNQIIPADWSIS